MQGEEIIQAFLIYLNQEYGKNIQNMKELQNNYYMLKIRKFSHKEIIKHENVDVLQYHQSKEIQRNSKNQELSDLLNTQHVFKFEPGSNPTGVVWKYSIYRNRNHKWDNVNQKDYETYLEIEGIKDAESIPDKLDEGDIKTYFESIINLKMNELQTKRAQYKLIPKKKTIKESIKNAKELQARLMHSEI